MTPVLIALGAAALGGAAYLYHEEHKKKDAKPTPPPAVNPPAIIPSVVVTPPKTGRGSGVMDEPIPLGPSGLPAAAPPVPVPSKIPIPAVPNPSGALLGAAVNTATGNALAHMTQPQPADQPPLPPVSPAFDTVPPGKKGRVTTQSEGQLGNLRVRTAPSTTASVVPGGEPSIGGGVPKGEIVTITGPAKEGFVPLEWKGIKGWGWAGYVTIL